MLGSTPEREPQGDEEILFIHENVSYLILLKEKLAPHSYHNFRNEENVSVIQRKTELGTGLMKFWVYRAYVKYVSIIIKKN